MNKTAPLWMTLFITIIIGSFVWLSGVWIGEQTAPEYQTLIWHSNPDLIHLSGKYRVMIHDQHGNYIGYLHLSRTEMKRPLKIITDYRFEEFGKEVADALPR